MNPALPFDPTSLPMESEAETRARHSSVEWREPGRASEPVFHDDFTLDPALGGYPPSGRREDLFTEGYEDLPVHVTSIEDGVLFGQEFLVCDRLVPTVSNRRLFLARLSRLAERLDTLEPLDVPAGPLYLAGSSAPHANFYHWCFQCLPNIALLRRMARQRGLDYRLVLPPLDAVRERSLELLGIAPTERLTLPPDRFLCGVPLMYSSAACSDYTFQPSARLIELLDPYKEACLANASATLPTRFYLSRRDAPRKRPMRNERELADALASRGHPELLMSELSLEDQVAAFARAESIVAPHGAGLVNLMFAPCDARLVEILPANYRRAHFFRLAQVRGIGYSQVLAEVIEEEAGALHDSVLEVDVSRVLATLERSEAARARAAVAARRAG